MRKVEDEAKKMQGTQQRAELQVPKPTPIFRRRAWLTFQRALDPLAPPKPIRPPRQHD